MSFKVSVLGLACLLVAVLASSAEAQRSYPLSGNARFQIGDGLPIPIGFTAPPNGKVFAINGARVTQTTVGSDPRQMSFQPGQLHHPGGNINLPVFAFNSKVFQVKTNIEILVPAPNGGPGSLGSDNTLKAGGRTGAAVVTFCPGQSVTPIGNPNCSAGSPSGGPGTPQHPVAGFMKYTSTGAQFGGGMRGNGGGSADVGIVAAVPSPPLPCNHAGPAGPGGSPCRVIFALASPAGTGVVGGPFGAVVSSPGAPPPAPGGFRNAKIGAGGTILSVTAPGLGAGLANPATSYGGPWTDGSLTVVQSGAVGSAETFTMMGSDQRVNGVGTISLVAGGLSARGVSGPNANRGWLNLTVGGDTPGLSGWGIGVLAMLLGSAGVWRARRAMAS
jgi:hypothetical protein